MGVKVIVLRYCTINFSSKIFQVFSTQPFLLHLPQHVPSPLLVCFFINEHIFMPSNQLHTWLKKRDWFLAVWGYFVGLEGDGPRLYAPVAYLNNEMIRWIKSRS